MTRIMVLNIICIRRTLWSWLCRPMSGNIDRAVCLAATKRIQSLFEHLIRRKYKHIDAIRSSIRCLQKYFGKSLKCLSVGGVQLYTLHVSPQKLIESTWRKCILNGATITAYLSLAYCSFSPIASFLSLLKQQVGKGRLSRIGLFGDLIHNTEMCLARLANTAME